MSIWDDVIIGSGERGKSAFATRVFSIEDDHRIYEDKVSYWVAGLYSDLGMTVFKDTPEGIKLTRMIKEKGGREEILAFLEDILLRNLSRSKLKEAIDRAIKRSFEEGRKSKATEIRGVLGLYC